MSHKQKDKKNQNKAKEQNTIVVSTIEDVLIFIRDGECCIVSQPHVEWVKRGCKDVAGMLLMQLKKILCLTCGIGGWLI